MSDQTLPEPAADERTPYALWVHLQAREGHGPEVEARMQAAGRIIREEEGNVGFDVYRDRADPDAVHVYESYVDIEAYRTHLAAIPGIEAVADLGDHLAREYTVTFLRHAG